MSCLLVLSFIACSIIAISLILNTLALVLFILIVGLLSFHQFLQFMSCIIRLCVEVVYGAGQSNGLMAGQSCWIIGGTGYY